HPAPRALHSFPTRRSSDLERQLQCGGSCHERGAGLLGPPWPTKRFAAPHSTPSTSAWGPSSSPLRAGKCPSSTKVLRPSIRRLEDRKSTRLNSSHLGISYA